MMKMLPANCWASVSKRKTNCPPGSNRRSGVEAFFFSFSLPVSHVDVLTDIQVKQHQLAAIEAIQSDSRRCCCCAAQVRRPPTTTNRVSRPSRKQVGVKLDIN